MVTTNSTKKATWNDAVEICKKWYSGSCYECPLCNACIHENRGKSYTAKELEECMIEAVEKLWGGNKISG